MGGRMWVKSPWRAPGGQGRVRRGSAFHFTATLGLHRNTLQHEVNRQHVALAGQSVLIVDDNANSRLILSEVVRTWGMMPVTVADGHLALDALGSPHRTGNPFPIAL